MSRRGTSPPSTRLGLPDLFRDGRFEQVLIATFGADLEFYERVLRRHFGNFRNQIVLADGHQLDRTVASLAATGVLRHLNRSWLAGPVRVRHSAHAKVVLLAGPESGLLLVGSGNLNLSGYAGAGECFTPYRWNPEDPDALHAFTAVRALTDGLVSLGYLDDVTIERLGTFWSAYDWWHSAPVTDGPVRHNLDTPIGQQFVDVIGSDPVEELTIAVPFHDPRCSALNRLAAELAPQRLRVLVQDSQCSVDPGRLAAVVKKHSGEVYTIDAAGDRSGTYLHAKVVLAKTRRRAVCLTGSANCSMVALWTTHPDANVELANLVVGERDAFDHLLDPEVVTIAGPVDPASLGLRIQGDDEEDNDGPPATRVVDVRWTSPRLRARVSPPVHDADRVAIGIGSRTVHATVVLKQIDSDWTELTAQLSEQSDVEAVDGVAFVSIVVDGTTVCVAVPYQVERLREQDRRRVDADRLRHAARLELEDPDLEQALAALEEILVGDNAARWGRDSSTLHDDDEQGPSIAWEDIDWSAVRRHPRFTSYGGLAGLGTPGSGLATYLEALSQVVRELLDTEDASAEGISHTEPSSAEDDDDLGEEPDVADGLEGADVDVEGEVEVDEPGRQSPAARNRRLIRNFVRRNLRALEQPAFRAGVGPGIVIPNIIILNWVCWWVATKDEDHFHAELVDERIRLWKLLWGTSAGEPGYLDGLDNEHQQLVIERFDDQRFEAVTVASIGDVWASIREVTDPEYRALREVLRQAVGHPCWQVTAQALDYAATLTNGRPTTTSATTALELAERMWKATCEPHGDFETRSAIARHLGLQPSAVSMGTESVCVDGDSATKVVWQANVDAHFDAATAAALIEIWLGIEDLSFYRVKWSDGVAFYNAFTERGLVATSDGREITLRELEPRYPSWRTALDRLSETVETRREVAA